MQNSLENSVVSIEKLEKSPSRALGFPPQQEQSIRFIICNFIDSSAILLKLPQNVSATAQVLVQRFYFMEPLNSLPLFVLCKI
jgi:hypothetical protein